MSVLPSPIPHPWTTPWDVPGWIYEALDWVVGVRVAGGQRAGRLGLADQWYAVASVLAGPHADAAAAAVEVHNGYGGVGAVDAAFEAAWRGIAEGADAPLPVLLAVRPTWADWSRSAAATSRAPSSKSGSSWASWSSSCSPWRWRRC